MVMELYASGETAEIFAAMTRNGFFKQMTHHSTTSQYGTLSRGPSLINDAMRTHAREILRSDIKGGAFVREWSNEQACAAARAGIPRISSRSSRIACPDGSVCSPSSASPAIPVSRLLKS
jgi:ketol-acid reductoisomerase